MEAKTAGENDQSDDMQIPFVRAPRVWRPSIDPTVLREKLTFSSSFCRENGLELPPLVEAVFS